MMEWIASLLATPPSLLGGEDLLSLSPPLQFRQNFTKALSSLACYFSDFTI